MFMYYTNIKSLVFCLVFIGSFFMSFLLFSLGNFPYDNLSYFATVLKCTCVSFTIQKFSNLTRKKSYYDKEMLSIAFCVSLFVFSSFSVGHCIACPSIYGLCSLLLVYIFKLFSEKKLNINVIYHKNNDKISNIYCYWKYIYYRCWSIQNDDVRLTDNIRSYAYILN